MPVLVPDLLYDGGSFRAGLAVECGAGGRIARVGPAAELVGAARERGDVVERLSGRALLPGFVNAHSHAFQRLLRGRAEWRPAAEPRADFWTWRRAMYEVALALSPDDVQDVARFCFLEMLRAGITAVGEFHYLHRDEAGRPYADPNELAHRVVAAAAEVGIRLVLLDACYAAGGVGRPLLSEQRRFATPDLDAFLAGADALAAAYRGARAVSVGLAPHSVRAVPRGWLAELAGWAAARDVALHIHVAEQPAEVEECRSAYGLRPVELLAEEGVLSERLTAVHAIHVAPEEVALLGDAGASVCACPTTERDLGDGFVPVAELVAAGARLCFGTDSQAVIDPFEEMRLLEYHERLRRMRRVVLAVPGAAGRLEVAPFLLDVASVGGARALRLDAGRIAPGSWADLVALDLGHPALAGWTEGTLAALVALSAPVGVVTDVWVGGARRVEAGRHVLDDVAAAAFRRVAARVG